MFKMTMHICFECASVKAYLYIMKQEINVYTKGGVQDMRTLKKNNKRTD